MGYVVLSGSPAAAIAMALLSTGTFHGESNTTVHDETSSLLLSQASHPLRLVYNVAQPPLICTV